MTPVINKGGEYFAGADIEGVEKHYNAKYVGTFAIKGRYGWTEQPALIFYNEVPPNPAYSQYFALVRRDGTWYVTDGSSVAETPIAGIQHPETGEIIFSRWRHDYRQFKDGSGAIDGGFDYIKRAGVGIPVMLVVRDGEIQIEEDPDALEVMYKLRQE